MVISMALGDWSLETMRIRDWSLRTAVLGDWSLGTQVQAQLSQALHTGSGSTDPAHPT